ncbi:MAG: YidC/Oxa1 family rane protein insertase [Thermoleophilaceae bacterium]|nr:YidC/Oxa1 family rane protein insertase [Thermoleophilaceae bacterium]
MFFVTGNILQPLIDVNEAVLRFFYNDVGFGWGLSIICLTLAIRLVILPLTYKQVRSMQEMQRFSPEIQRIRDRYKDDKTRQNEELMALYKEHGFNPLGSCLPLVLQLPFFFSLYQTLKAGGDISKEIGNSGHTSFVWMPDLTAPLTHHTGALVFTVVLYVSTQLGSSYVSSLNVQDKNQRRLLFIFPFVFVPIVINFPAGLLVYWITTNFFTISQQLVIRRFMPKPDPHDFETTRGSGGKGDEKADGDGARPSRKRGPRTPKGATAAVADGKPAKKEPKASSSGSNGKGSNGKGATAAARAGGPPPRSPRKKKKRTGRRR